MIRGCGAIAQDRNAGNNITADLTSLITVTTLPSTDGSGSTCDLGQLMLSLCNPGTYAYTYTVTNSNGALASVTRTLIVYNVSYFTLPGVIVFPAITNGNIATLTAATLNGNDAMATSNYTAATKGVARRLASLGILDSDVDVYDAAVATVKISNTVRVYNVSVTAKVWWFFPSTVHRSMLRTYQSAVSSAKLQHGDSVPVQKSRLLASRLNSSSGHRRRQLDTPGSSSDLSPAVALAEDARSLTKMQAAYEGSSSAPSGLTGSPDVADWDHPGHGGLSDSPAAAGSAPISPARFGQLEAAEAVTLSGRGLSSEHPIQSAQGLLGPAASAGLRPRKLLDVASSMMVAASSTSVSSTTTSVAPDAAANTLASITGLMQILLNETSAGGSALNKVASGISDSIHQAVTIEGLRGNQVSRATK